MSNISNFSENASGEPCFKSPDDVEKPVLTILYQDEYLVAVDKPAGLFVHRSFMDKDEIYFALQLVRDQIGQYVYPVHRLDRPTSGVLIFALTKGVAQKLNNDFALKSAGNKDTGLSKVYYALVRGFLPMTAEQQFIDYPLKEKIDKLGDKYVNQHKAAQTAQTYYQVVQQASLPIALGKFNTVRYSLVKLEPVTGRRHQLRRHLAHLRHPIIGDINYGDNKQNPFYTQYFGYKRLMLMAKSLTFIHPVTRKSLTITAAYDQQWQYMFEKLNFTKQLID